MGRFTSGLFSLGLFIAAAMLFYVQPMIAKRVLPVLGGAPAVWTTCLLFFQSALLVGYAYAHASIHWLGVRRQAGLQIALILLPLIVAPMTAIAAPISPPASSARPEAWLLLFLCRSVGLPFVLIATTGPLLQRWFASTGHPWAANPYHLFAASNLGSVVALVSYPLIVEPYLRLSKQLSLWSTGYLVFVCVIIACALLVMRSPVEPAQTELDSGSGRPAWRRWFVWVALSCLPSSYLLSVTSYLSTDIAAVPLLWVIPLLLYLLTFILTFARRPLFSQGVFVRLLPLGVVALLPAMGVGMVQPIWIPLHLITFFVVVMVCHGRLAAERPEPSHLTAFYLAIAFGGAIGGVFNALIAPLVFNRIAEYPLDLFLACLVLPNARVIDRTPRTLLTDLSMPAAIFLLVTALVTNLSGLAESMLGALGVMMAFGLFFYVFWARLKRPLRFALSVGAVLLASGFSPGVDGRTLLRDRSFFGVVRVTEVAKEQIHRLFHGSTLHGQQSLDPARRREPLTYFARSGPIGQVFEQITEKESLRNVAIVGLGAGTLACYANAGERWTFYEIDPVVQRIASDPRYFTFLADSRAESTEVVIGDARVRLRDAPAHGYQLIILDAFSSDALPVHLITREAIQLYKNKLAPGGLIVFNLSNRYLDLEPVVAALAIDAGLTCRIREDRNLSAAEKRDGKQPSIWAVLAAREAEIGSIMADDRWKACRGLSDATVWTDDYSNIIGHFRFLGPRR